MIQKNLPSCHLTGNPSAHEKFICGSTANPTRVQKLAGDRHPVGRVHGVLGHPQHRRLHLAAVGRRHRAFQGPRALRPLEVLHRPLLVLRRIIPGTPEIWIGIAPRHYADRQAPIETSSVSPDRSHSFNDSCRDPVPYLPFSKLILMPTELNFIMLLGGKCSQQTDQIFQSRTR